MTNNDPLGELVSLMPGYGGYREREMRRESDKLVRLRILSSVRYASNRVDDLARRVYSMKESEELYSVIDRVRWRIQLLETHIRGLEYGYAPLNALAKINEDKLDALIGYDEILIHGSERLRQQIDDLSKPMDGLDQIHASLSNLETIVSDIESQLQRRQELFLQ